MIPVDVTGDDREEAALVDPQGTIYVIVLGGSRPADNPEMNQRLDFSVQRAAESWTAGLEPTHVDLDGSGGEEFLVVARTNGEIWRMSFDTTSRLNDRSRVATDLPAE